MSNLYPNRYTLDQNLHRAVNVNKSLAHQIVGARHQVSRFTVMGGKICHFCTIFDTFVFEPWLCPSASKRGDGSRREKFLRFFLYLSAQQAKLQSFYQQNCPFEPLEPHILGQKGQNETLQKAIETKFEYILHIWNMYLGGSIWRPVKA